MKIKSVALIIRKLPAGGVLIFGKGIQVPEEISKMKDPDDDYLILGSLELDDQHIFNGYTLDAGNSPNDLLVREGLNWKFYKHKIK